LVTDGKTLIEHMTVSGLTYLISECTGFIASHLRWNVEVMGIGAFAPSYKENKRDRYE
jgi:hypothetical protein